MRFKPTIMQLIEALPRQTLMTIDTMMIEGTPVTDVVRYIQQDQKLLVDQNEKTLADALRARLRAKQQAARVLEVEDDGYEEDGGSWANTQTMGQVPQTKTPSLMTKVLYDRVRQGMDDLVELEAMFLVQKQRIDKMVMLENQSMGIVEDLGDQIEKAAKIILARTKVKKDLGLMGDSFSMNLSVRGYTDNVVATLSNPESRRRVMSLVEQTVSAAAVEETDAIDAELVDGQEDDDD